MAATGGSLAARGDSIISQLSLAVKVTDRPTLTTLYTSGKAPVIYARGAVQLSSTAGQSQTTGHNPSSCSMAQLLGPSSSAGRQETTGRWTPAQLTVIIDPSSVPSSRRLLVSPLYCSSFDLILLDKVETILQYSIVCICC